MRWNRSGSALLDPRVLLGLGAGEPVLGILVHQPHRARRTCGCTCASSRGSATARRCRCGRGRWRRCDGRSADRARAAPGPARPGRAATSGHASSARGERAAAAVADADRRVPSCASDRRARRCRARAPPPRVDQRQVGTPEAIERSLTGGVRRAERRRRELPGTTGSMPLRG